MMEAEFHSRSGPASCGPNVSGNTPQRSMWRFLYIAGCILLYGRSVHREAAQRWPHRRHS